MQTEDKKTLKAILQAQIALEETGDPDEALDALNEISVEGITDEVAHKLRKAREEIESGDPFIAGDLWLNEALNLVMDGRPKRVETSSGPFSNELKRRWETVPAQ